MRNVEIHEVRSVRLAADRSGNIVECRNKVVYLPERLTGGDAPAAGEYMAVYRSHRALLGVRFGGRVYAYGAESGKSVAEELERADMGR
jgi:hypothetical protein